MKQILPETVECTHCKRMKKPSEFYSDIRNGGRRFGLSYNCRVCILKKAKTKRKNKPPSPTKKDLDFWDINGNGIFM